MVVRTRLRGFAYPIALYCISGGVGGYFVWHAINGDRGLKVGAEYKKSIAMLTTDLAATKAERALWRQRIALLSGAAIDRDLLDEQARVSLDRVGRNDVVIFLPQAR